MAIRASVTPLAEPGHAVLRIGELDDAAPQGLTLSIQRQQGPDSHLADDGWRRTEAWLQPRAVGRRGGVLEFRLGPEICDRLAGIATVRLRVREPDIGVVGTTVVAWPAMLTSGALDRGGRVDDEAARPPADEPPIAPPDPEPELPPPLPPSRPELGGATRPVPAPRRSGAGPWLVALVALAVAAGGGFYAWQTWLQPPPQAAVTAPDSKPAAASDAPRKSARDRVGEFLATKPAADAILAKARELAKADDSAAAFLLFRSAAETGSVPAELELAGYFDPLSGPPRGGFTPDGARAADWYERAALAGSAEAQRRLGLLLAKGGGGLAADPAKAKAWLQQAAAQNDGEAKKALESLPR